MEFKKKWLRFVYSQRLAFNVFRSEPWLDVVRQFRDLPGPVKVLWPSKHEITDIETIVHTADDVGADLAEVRAPFYVTGATIMSDGRKSRDARPIVNFLAGGSCGVMLVRTMNREGERDDVLARWIKVFDDFSPKWVNGTCTDSASAYVAAANMLQGPQQRPEHQRITSLPCAVQVCNKMLSDIGCSGPWSKDIIVRGRAMARFIKEHDAALHIFRGESTQMGLIYPCETRFASVFAMVERLLTLRSALERTVDGDTWGMVPWDHSVRQLARWVRWQVRHGSWWDSMGILFRIMEPVYDLLRRLDRRGLHMSRVVEWTQDLARQVAEEVCALPADLLHYIVQRVQARCAHMLEPTHVAAHLLCPSRQDLRYFEGVGRSGMASSTALPTSTDQLHRQLAGSNRLQRLVRGPRQRLEDRLEGGPMLVQGDDGDRQGLVGGDGGAMAGGGGGAEVDAAVEGIPMGGGGGFSEFGDMGMPPGESVGLPRGDSESRGDISVGMQALLGQISLLDPNSFSPAMHGEVMSGAEGDEDRTPPGETSEERLDRLESRRACLMAQRDPRTQELARLAAEDRQRQMGTYTTASVDVGPAAHTDTPAEVHDTTQWEAASAEVSSTGVDVQQGTHESGLAPTEEPRSEPAQPPVVQLRPEETLQEVAGVPLPAGSVEGAVHMSPGLEDIQTGQSVGVDDIRLSAQAEGIAPTTGGDGAVAGAVGFGGSEVPPAADLMSTSGGGDPAQVDRRDADGQDMPQTLVLRTAVGPVVPHQAPFLEGYRRPAQGGGQVEERRGLPSGGSVAAASGGVAGDLPSGGSVAAPTGGAAGPSSPLSIAPREGGSLTPRSVARRRRDTTQRARELLDTMLFGRTDRPWSETRRVMTASAGRQLGLRGVSTSARRRDVVAAGFGGRGGGDGGSGGDGDGRREGAGGATTSAADPPRTYGLREASIILEEPDFVTRLRQARHVPLDRRQEWETSGTDGLPMARESRPRDDLAATAIRTVRGRKVIMDDDPDELPVAPEPSAGGHGG
ncbi:hypothetical protein CBR_g4486 [Chara braunii]|uniref:DUF659 domain-containing protein n=1 Tax=Chara braunii TaxID=69332 RepID=A0A388KI00_CHABU|nr:hypothetical protein CBR_g4486 [Chara braunii]|eukprot:GBG69656.1 hypothetical protein CBR_g4486 [Chara braunii]